MSNPAIVARAVGKLPDIPFPDPLTLTPFPKELDPALACAKPRVPGRSLPPKVSPIHRKLYDACSKALTEPAKAEGARDFDSCHRLSHMLRTGYGGPDDPTLAVQIDARACGLGDLEACASLAGPSLTGHGAVFDPACGEAVLRHTCDQGHGGACASLGNLELRGDVVAFDPAGAQSSFERGCRAESYRACLSLAGTLRKGDPARASIHEKTALRLADAACRAGDGEACSDLAWLYRSEMRGGRFSDELRASVADVEKAQQYAELACRTGARYGCMDNAKTVVIERELCETGDFERCIDLSFEHINGGGGGGRKTAADDKAIEAACIGGSARGCWALGEHASLVVLEEACAAGVLDACRPQSKNGLLITRTNELRKKACEQGSAIDCRELGEQEAKAGLDKDAFAHFERACPSLRWSLESRDVDAVACVEAGRRYRKGEGVSIDPARAIELFLLGCYAEGRLNDRGLGCAEAAEMFDAGEGVPRDADRATDLLAGLCSAQHRRCDLFEKRKPEVRP